VCAAMLTGAAKLQFAFQAVLPSKHAVHYGDIVIIICVINYDGVVAMCPLLLVEPGIQHNPAV
jgi:hypothetical protein